MDFGSIIDWVWSVIQQVIDFVTSIIGDLINALNAVFGAIWNFLGNLVQALVDIFQKVAAFFAHLWQDYIKPAIDGLVNLYKSIVAWLKHILTPILNIIQRIRNFYYQYIYKWVQLAQQILSIVRAFLAALRILGVKWAAKLDAELAKIQGFITQWTSTFVATLNQATTWLNFIADPLGIVRRDVFKNSLFGSLLQTRNAVRAGSDRALYASEASNTQGDRAMVQGGASVLTRNADGSVNYSDASSRINDGFTAGWNDYGNPKL